MKYHYIRNNHKIAEIEQDEDVGFYLYVFSPNSKSCIADYLQDTLEAAQEQAWEEYKIPISDWEGIE